MKVAPKVVEKFRELREEFTRYDGFVHTWITPSTASSPTSPAASFYVLMGVTQDYVSATRTLTWWGGQQVCAKNPLEMDADNLAVVILSH